MTCVVDLGSRRPPFTTSMNDGQGGYPQLGATFTPGGMDDFYMPEVVSPAPQRYVPVKKYIEDAHA